ncbi:Cupredoxin [Dichotomocladium elegans]|nr:Cupredoxin [Dichotomocladium elegans]
MKNGRGLLSLFFIFLAGPVCYVSAALRRYELNIGYSLLNPDCHDTLFPSLLVNNQFPGPTIRVVKGDDVEIVVRNQITAMNVTTSIHFHGIRQYGTVDSDGVPDVTQSAIGPGETFTYRFRVINQSGTFFYHAHVGMQDDTVQGPFIVHDSLDSWPREGDEMSEGIYTYDGERTLQISEWWRELFTDREDYYMSSRFTFDKGANSILLNGRTVHQDYFTRSNGGGPTSECPGYSTIDVEPNKTYRLRIIGAMTFRTLGLAIGGHNMTVIEADGQLTKPYETDWLEIGPGQRFSVLIHTHSEVNGGALFPIATSYRWRNRSKGLYTENGFGYLRYKKGAAAACVCQEMCYNSTVFKPVQPDKGTHLPTFPSENKPGWQWPDIMPLTEDTDTALLLAAPAHRTIKLRTTAVRQPNNQTRYMMNGRHPVARVRPVLTDMMEGVYSAGAIRTIDPDGYAVESGTYPIQFGEVVDIVLQNVQDGPNCLIHPWHTHGHSHYHLASGEGEYEEEIHGNIRSFPSPLFRDVSMVYPSEKGLNNGCGWSKIRLVADNPGFWALHCHITAHMMQGKMVVLEESPELIEATKLYA